MNEELLEAIRQQYARNDGNLDAFEREKGKLTRLLEELADELRQTYQLQSCIGRGGAGLVLTVKDNNLGIHRALKLPRPLEERLRESIRNEIDHLKELDHPNLTRIYHAGELALDAHENYPYYIMDFVPDAIDLARAVKTKLDKSRSSSDLKNVTGWLVRVLTNVVDALDYLHRKQIIHFDVKPANILLDGYSRPILTDLGYAKKKSDRQTKTVVGFTLYYAHPDLSEQYQHMSSANRVRTEKAPRDFKFAWDIYALGQTILHLLSLLDHQWPEAVMYDYIFSYIHLMACRMLDGRNLPKDVVENIRRSQGESPVKYWEHWLRLGATEFSSLKYASLDQVKEDFKKLETPDYYLDGVPELSPYYPGRVQVAASLPAPFSARVKAILEHPVFMRLQSVKQLGLADTVYPGCTHTRAEHSLGVFRVCWLYLQALWNDPYNPLFRVLINCKDLKAVLLAALLHDLGQYPLAHEMEEAVPVDKRDFFDHERLTGKWLESEHVDSESRTLRRIIEELWGVEIEVVKDVLSPERLLGEAVDLKVDLLHSIVDGPIDCDKADYLIRDSRRAELPYGSAIDLERLVRSLTVVLANGRDHVRLRLGCYERGLSAAESLAFARYQLYEALYWHHTVRAVRPMLREVFRRGLNKRREKDLGGRFLRFLGIGGDRPSWVTVDDLLGMLRDCCNDHGQELLDMIRGRRYYKRLISVHAYADVGGGPGLVERVRGAARSPDFDERLRGCVFEFVRRHVDGLTGPAASGFGNGGGSALLEELEKPGRILVDCPEPRIGSEDRLRVALEPKRMLRNYLSRLEQADRVSEVWEEVYGRLMRIASKARVYCHPSVRDGLMAVLGPEGIRQALQEVL